MLRRVVEAMLDESQHGFMKEKGTADCTFMLRLIIEKILEFDQRLFITFMDLEKAYDFVVRERVWEVLAELGVDPDLTENIKALYRDSIAMVRVAGELSEPFRIKRGLRQGCPLSPLLFIVAFNQICRKIKLQKTGIPLTREEWLQLLAFADDTALLSQDAREMQLLIDVFVEACASLGLRVNVPKTKFMVINKKKLDDVQQHPFTIYGQPIDQVDELVYLGSLITADGTAKADIRTRVQKASKAHGALKKYIFCNRHVPREAKMKCVHGAVEPVLLFGCESWAMTTEDRRRVDVAQMKWLRNILGITLWHRRRNEQVRRSCSTQQVSTKIARHQLRYYGHVARMAPERLAKQVKNWQQPEEWKRPRGRPHLRWTDTIRRNLDKIGIDSFEKADDEASNRTGWRAKINSIND
jgi:Reverse transcriptase (RNA-dependent DNA polymerase)